jgi:hypothetical protein
MPRVRNRATRSLPTATHTSPSPESMCRGIPTGNVDIRFSFLMSPELRGQRSTRSYGPRAISPTMKPCHQRVKAGHHTHTRQRTLLAVRPFESAVSYRRMSGANALESSPTRLAQTTCGKGLWGRAGARCVPMLEGLHQRAGEQGAGVLRQRRPLARTSVRTAGSRNSHPEDARDAAADSGSQQG